MRRRIFCKYFLNSFFLSNISFSYGDAKTPRSFIWQKDDLILDQSGSFGDQVFVIGALSCTNMSGVARQIKEIRRRLHFKCCLSHSSRNKWKKEYAKKLIDLWLDGKDIKIDLIIFKRKKGFKDLKSSAKLPVYIDLVSRLIDSSTLSRAGKVRLVTQPHFKSELQNRLESSLLTRNAHLAGVIHVHEKEHDLLQLTDLIVGAVRSCQNSVINNELTNVTNTTKIEIIKYLSKKLNVESLSANLMHPKISIIIE